MKVKASSLFFALIISLLIALVTSSFILVTNWHWISTDQYIQEQRLINNCESGLSLLMSKNTEIGSEAFVIDLFDQQEHSVSLSLKKWGLYEKGTSKSFSQGDTIGKTILIGRTMSASDRFSLYLTDRNSPLALCGNTLIKGKAYLPEAGVKRAYIEGQNFVGSKMIDGPVGRSQNRILSLPNNLQNITYETQSTINSEEINFFEIENDSITRSFQERTLIINITDSIVLTNLKLKGNIIVRSTQPLFIARNSTLEDVLVFAPAIYVDDYTQFKCQLFGERKIELGQNVAADFPSVLYVAANSSEGAARVEIGQTSQVAGTVVINVKQSGQTGSISIEEGVIITGQVYSSHSVDLKGSIYGNLICDKLSLKTPSSVYVNHLLNAEINASKLPENFPGITCFGAELDKRIISFPL